MRRSAVPLLVVLCVAAARAQQPAPSRADEAAIVEQTRTTIRYEEDGTGTRETYMRIKAQSEAGVQQWGQVIAGYNAATERLDIPLVRVRKSDGTTVDTPASAIQDLTSPVSRIAPVYTDYHQKHVTVQSFRPGDTLEVRMVTTIHTPLAARQFWTDYNFTDEGIVLDEQLDLDVPAARRVTVKSRAGFEPSIKESGGRRTYHWTHAHLAREKKDEADTKDKKKASPDQPEPAAVRVTTFADWAEVGRWFSGLEKTARTPTPDVKAKAAQLTAGRATDMEKLEALYDYVSKNFRYVSLSLGLGRYQPRAAGDVLRDAYGDCKDKHTLLAALIDASGFQSSAALINSSVKIDPDFPSPGQFDHVITRASVGGQVVWLDATPEVAPFRLLSGNLRAKQALVTGLEPAPRLEETPADPPMPAQGDTTIDGSLDAAGTLSATVALTFRGDMELAMRTAFRMVPAARWQEVVEEIVRQSDFDAKVSAVNVSDPQATREPFAIRFTVEAVGFADFAKKKFDLELPLAGRGGLSDLPDTDPIAVGGPIQFAYRLTLKLPAGAKVRLPLPVNVTRDYGDYHSRYEATAETLTATRSLVLKPRELPDTRRADILSFLRVALNDASQKPGVDATAMTAVANVPPAAQAKRLSQSGYEAFVARDYERAVELLRRVVELEPKDKTAWTNLGRSYMALRRTDEAIAAFKTQIELNPYDEYAYNNLGFAYASQDKTAEAEAAYLKQLELNPLDGYAYSALGRLYLRTHADEKAAASLEKAIAIAPDSASVQVDLGQAYLNLKQIDKARAAFSRAVELSPTEGTWNGVAYQLALGGVDLDRAQQYAESAVSSAAAASRILDVERADAGAFDVVNSLAADWDTLGWVYFAKGDLANAQRFVAPAWKLSEHAEVGDHLGQIFEKLGQRDKAIAAYAAALSSRQPAPEVREHLARVAGAAGVEKAKADHRGDMPRARTFALPGAGPAGKKADVLVLFSAPDLVESVKFIGGDEALRPLTAAIKQFPAAGMFPDSSPSRILRRGLVTCTDRGACTVALILPEDARPVK
jgi:tetratricopeptide (TPR) repeat protein/transglutaminase-like putative cysteine protease